MSTTTTRSGSTDLAFLDEVTASEHLWSDRDEEAQAIAQHLLRAVSPIVVLHGPRHSGKSDLIRRRVVPLVSEQRRVRLRDATYPPEPSNPGGADTIEFWDSFESALTEDEATRDSVIREISRALESAGRGCRLVLIIADDGLSRLLQLCSAVPQIVEDIYELPRIATRPLLERLSGLTTQHGVGIAESFLAALTRDLTAENGAAGSELAAILAFEICRLKPADNEATDKYYESRGRLPGILEAHLNWLLERLPDGLDPQMGWAVIDEIVALRTATDQPPDLLDIARRFDVAPEIPGQVLGWLEQTRHIVQRRPTGEFDLVPAQLVLAARARQQRDALADEHHRWVLRQAARNVADAEALLSEQVFRRIHARRAAMRVSEEEASIMLRCALVYEDANLEGATRYWQQRVTDPDSQVDALLEAVFDSRPGVRRRAAKHLSTFARSDVRNQLHLLALRDPDDAVRAQAIDSLDAIKDETLQVSLIRELREPNSPYRLQAIDVLRIFDTRAATDALVGIVRTNRVGEDLEARRRAIDVLGRGQTTEAAGALLDVALQDSDPEDRERAALALGSMSSKPALRLLLDRLHELTGDAKTLHFSLSWRAAVLWFFNALLGIGAVLANIFLHGFVLLTMRRWRLGLAVTALGGVAMALLNSVSYAELGVLMFAATLVFGLLASFRLLVLERLAGAPISWYRRCLGVAVFASCLCLPIFPLFHGLPCMLSKRFRRGVALTVFEAVAGVLIAGAGYIYTQFSAFNELSMVFSAISYSFWIIAGVMLAITFVVGIGSAWFDAFGFQSRRRKLRRVAEVQTALSSNRLVPALLLDDCLRAKRQKARWSRRILRRFGREMRTGLRDGWDQADSVTRQEIFSIMASRHDPSSMEFLQTVVPSLNWRARLEYWWASLTFRVALWPKPLLGTVGIWLFVLIAAVAVSYERLIVVDPTRLAATVSGNTESVEVRTEAIGKLRQLAQQNRSSDVANVAKASLLNFVTEEEFAQQDSALQLAGLRAVAAVGRAEERTPLVVAVANRFASPDLRQQVVMTLTAIGSVEASRKLKEFIEQPLPARGAADEVKIRGEAIDALATIGGIYTFDALTTLSASEALGPELKKRAQQALASFDPIIQAESAVTNGQYADAIALATRMLGAGPSDPQRVRSVLNRAYTVQGSIAVNEGRYADAKASLLAALDPALSTGDGRSLLDLGLNLAYEYHEKQAPNDPNAYADVYDVLSRLRSFDGDPATKRSLEANFVEANLTTGRYADAVRLARELIKNPELEQENALNMRFMVYAGLALSGKSSDSAWKDVLAYYQQRPSGFRNSWSYTGTRSYLQRAPLPPPDKMRLLETLDQIEQTK